MKVSKFIVATKQQSGDNWIKTKPFAKIGRDRHDRRKRVIDSRNGLSAVTHVEIAARNAQTTSIYCVLDTGRTHQIRVHLASIGHPIVGDPLYQRKKLQLALSCMPMNFI